MPLARTHCSVKMMGASGAMSWIPMHRLRVPWTMATKPGIFSLGWVMGE